METSRLTIDCGNAMAAAVGPQHGVNDAMLDEIAPVVAERHERLQTEHAAGGQRRMGLPSAAALAAEITAVAGEAGARYSDFILIGAARYRAAVSVASVPAEIPELDHLRGADLGQLLRREQAATAWALRQARQPNLKFTAPVIDAAIVGELFYLYELRTVMAGAPLGINPFGQPGVEAGKNATYALMGQAGYESLRDELQSESGGEQYRLRA
jgi:hypothetical protein